MTDYYLIDTFSNSTLSQIEREFNGKELPDPKIYAFGNLVDSMVLGGNIEITGMAHDDLVLARKMTHAVHSDERVKLFLNHSKFLKQHEIYKKFYDLDFKCRMDGCLPPVVGFEFKTMASCSESTFPGIISMFNYDRQGYVYMEMSGVEQMYFVGVTKAKNPKVFVFIMKKGNRMWEEGKAKTEHLIGILKSLLI